MGLKAKVTREGVLIPEELFKEMMSAYVRAEQILATLETIADEETLKTIGILNPHPEEAIKNLFWDRDIPSEKIVNISAEFGTTQALDRIYWDWTVNVLKTAFPSGVSQYLSAVRKEMKKYLG